MVLVVQVTNKEWEYFVILLVDTANDDIVSALPTGLASYKEVRLFMFEFLFCKIIHISFPVL